MVKDWLRACGGRANRGHQKATAARLGEGERPQQGSF
jgi:hypothetical protein